MDNKILDSVKPIVVHLLLSAGKYIVAPIAAITGATEVNVQAWWITTAELLGAVIIGAVASWLDKKFHASQVEKADAKAAAPPV